MFFPQICQVTQHQPVPIHFVTKQRTAVLQDLLARQPLVLAGVALSRNLRNSESDIARGQAEASRRGDTPAR